ncbi:hypothetical protein BH11BAC3_BH11BAC3_27540 [soil metagenome]
MKAINIFFYFLFYFLFVAPFPSCSDNNKKVEQLLSQAEFPDKVTPYFPTSPIKSLHKAQVLNDFDNDRFSSALYALKDPVLYYKKDSGLTYRLSFFGNFTPSVSFTLKSYANKHYLIAKALNQQPQFWERGAKITTTTSDTFIARYKPDSLVFINFQKVAKLNPEQWQIIQGFLGKIKFWNSSTFEIREGSPTDITTWVLEGLSNNKYHFIVRSDSRPLEEFGHLLLKFSELPVKELN